MKSRLSSTRESMCSPGQTTRVNPLCCGCSENCWSTPSRCLPKFFGRIGLQWTLNISTATGVDPTQGTLPTEPEHLVSTYEKIGYTCYVPAQRCSTNSRSTGPTVSRGADSQFDELFELFAEERAETIRRIGKEAFRQAIQQDPANERHPELAKRSKLMMAGNTLVSDKAVKQRIVDLDYSSSRRQKPVIKTYLNQVASLAAQITEDFPIQFIGVEEDQEGLYPAFRTPDGDFPLDVLSVIRTLERNGDDQSVVDRLCALFSGAPLHSPSRRTSPAIR